MQITRLDSAEAPDWHAINEAHREAEAARLVEDAMRPVGSLPLDVMFDEVEADEFLVAALPSFAIASLASDRKTNGFDGQSKTRKAVGYKTPETVACSQTLQERLACLSRFQEQLAGEIENPDRIFFKAIEVVTFTGERFFDKEYIYDEAEIEAIKAKEHAALTVVAEALKIDIFEKHPRTKGFPGIHRTKDSNGAYANVAHLRSDSCEHSEDPLIQAMLNVLEKLVDDKPQPETRKRFGLYSTHGTQWDHIYDKSKAFDSWY